MSSLFQRHSTLLWQRALIALAGLVLFNQALFATANVADVQSKGDIVVVAVHGDVQVTMVGIVSPLYAGAILQLPATIRSGSDGAVELRQGPTTIAAAANTELEIPQSAEVHGLLERVVQIRGNAFYSVGKRERTRLRVETPYLVAVIKGTQFNVATQDDATTIALFEGRLEIRAADESDVVDLHAGEIAIRHRNDPSITVLRMTAVSNDVRRRQNDSVGASASGDASNPTASDGLSLANRNDSPQQMGETILADAVADNNFSELSAASNIAAQAALTTDNLDVGLAADTQLDLGTAKAALQVDTGLDAVNSSVSADVGIDASVGSAIVDAGISANVDLGGVGADIGADIGIDATVGGAAVAADIGASVDLGAGSVAADTGASLDLGSISAGVSADAGVDLPNGTIDANVGAVVDAGVVSADLDVGANAGIGGVAVTADTGADLAVATVDAGAGAAIDLGSTPAVSVDADLSAGAGGGDLVAAGLTAGVSDTTADLGATLDVGGTAAVDAAIDIPAGDVSANVDVGGIVDVGVDLGTGTIDLNIGGSDTGGGLLGGLLNRRSKN